MPERSTTRMVDKISVMFGLGLLKPAPGTWGSLPGIPLSWGLYYISSAIMGRKEEVLSGAAALLCAVILVVLSFAATLCIRATEKRWNCHDDKSIVIDEVLGQMVALSWFPPSAGISVAAFALFRFFDIVKPGPIGWVDKKVHSAFGTLLDDLLAGLFAALSLVFIRNLLS